MRVLFSLLFPATILGWGWWLIVSVPSNGESAASVPKSASHLVASDSSGNGNHGVNQGRPLLGLPGIEGTSYSFSRRGSWIQVPSNRTLNPESRDFAFSAWVRFAAAPEPGVTYDIVRKGLSFSSGGEFKMEVVDGGRVRCAAKGSSGAGSVIGPEASLADGEWHELRCVRRGSTWSVVIDGTATAETVALGSVANTMSLSIGSKYGHEDGFPGQIDEVRLSVAERPAGAGRGELVPAGWWHLDEVPRRGGQGALETVPDSS